LYSSSDAGIIKVIKSGGIRWAEHEAGQFMGEIVTKVQSGKLKVRDNLERGVYDRIVLECTTL
jgi:hypothetical protein